MKRVRLIAAVAALSMASIFGLVAASPAAVSATRVPAHASAPRAAADPLAVGTSAAGARSRSSATRAIPSGCVGWWCIFEGTGYHGTACTGVTNETDTSCRNLDESFVNDASDCGPNPYYQCTVRLYYHPLNVDNGGAWACIDFGKEISNLSGYTFNDGIGDSGYGASVWRDAAGVTVSSSACTNPIGPGL